jgi:hypothetical protein
MADLYGLSAADRDVLMRMIARERANYSANVRSLAPVPRKKIEWKPSSPGIASGLFKQSSQTYSGGATADITYQQAYTTAVDYLEPKQTSSKYTHIEIKKEGIYFLMGSGYMAASSWSYTTTESNIYDAFTRGQIIGELRDKNGSSVSSTGDTDEMGIQFVAGHRFGWSYTSAYAVVGVNPNLWPLSIRLQIYLNDTGKDASALAADGAWQFWRQGDELANF